MAIRICLKKNMASSLAVCIVCVLGFTAGIVDADTVKRDKLTLAGPIAAVSDPLIRMVATNALSDIAGTLEFVIWKNPDQMRALSINSRVDFIAMPTNVAANLYNRGVNLKLINVSIWGILWMVSREDQLSSIKHFQGKEIAIPFRGDMPDIIFKKLVRKAGLDLLQDFKLRYVANPLDAMQLLITRRVDHALLPEPAVSMALRKTRSFPLSVIAPDLYRSMDLQKEWGRLMQTEASMPQAGIVLLNQDLPEQVVARFMEEYKAAADWCNQYPDEAGELVSEYIDMLTPEAIADSIRFSPFKVVPAMQSKPALELFYRTLHEAEPALIGGQLPESGFYHKTKADQD